VAELLSKVEKQWDTIAPLETAEALITYCRTQNFSSLAEVIEKTLAANKQHEPTGEARHRQFQAMAIQAGLIYAYRKINGAWPR
jgi:hypothetical protein